MADNSGSDTDEQVATADDQGSPAPTPEEIEDQKAAQRKADDEIVVQAREFLKQAQEAENEIRSKALEDINFSTGEQWPANVKQDRERDGRPCLVVNRIPQFVQQVTNDQRQNRPSIKVHPVGDGADVETAKIMQGLIRHIEYNSNAEVAYDRAFESTVRGGFGFWRIVTDYAKPDSFDQEILIKSIRNPFTVYLDPHAQEPDGSDANSGMIGEWLTKDEFKSQFPGADQTNSLGWDQIGNRAPDWMREGSIFVAEYFYRVWEEKTLYRLSTGESVLEENLQKRLSEAAAANIPVQPIDSRKTKVPCVYWVKLNGIEILERGKWAGKFIPIIPVYGVEVDVNGKRTLEGIVRHAKDPQRMLNYWKSAETEAIALMPRAPFIGAEGQFEGHEQQWQTANRKNHAFLEYKPTTLAGQPVAPPQRSSVEPAVQAITMAGRGASQDLMDVTGINDPSRGFGPADQSGIALQKRNVQAQTANFHLVDNLNRSLRHTGKVIIDLIPKIYDTQRTARIIGDDGTHKLVTLNAPHKDDNGNEVLYEMDAGLYDVTMDTGPSFASKRQEAAESMQDVARSCPQIMNIAPDLFIGAMDWPMAQEISERFKKMLPPGIADDASNKQIPPQIQAQMQQQGQLIQKLSAEVHMQAQEIATERFKIESRERIERAKIEADIEINAAKLQSQSAIELMNQQIEALKHQIELMGLPQPQDGAQPQQPSPDGDAATGGQSPGQSMEQQP